MQHIDWEQRLTQKFEADNVLIFHPTLIIIFCDFKSSGGIFQLHSIKKKNSAQKIYEACPCGRKCENF